MATPTQPVTTLIHDIEDIVSLVADSPDYYVRSLAQRLIDGARRLREEMANARDFCPAHCFGILTRINGGGPAKEKP